MKASDVIRLLIRVVALALWADTLMSAFQPGGIFQAMTLDANGATGLVMTSLLLAAALFFGSERPIIMVLRWCGVGERAIVRQVALLSVLLTAMYWLDGSTYVWLRNETIQGLAYSHTMAPSYSLSILPATLWSALLFWCPCTAWARRLQFSAAGQTDWPDGLAGRRASPSGASGLSNSLARCDPIGVVPLYKPGARSLALVPAPASCPQRPGSGGIPPIFPVPNCLDHKSAGSQPRSTGDGADPCPADFVPGWDSDAGRMARSVRWNRTPDGLSGRARMGPSYLRIRGLHRAGFSVASDFSDRHRQCSHLRSANRPLLPRLHFDFSPVGGAGVSSPVRPEAVLAVANWHGGPLTM